MKMFVVYTAGNMLSMPIKINNKNKVEYLSMDNNFSMGYNKIGANSESTWPAKEIKEWLEIDNNIKRLFLKYIFKHI